MPSSVPGTKREPMLALGNDGVVLSSDHTGWPQGTRQPRVGQDINSQQTWETRGSHGQPLPLPWPHKSSQVPPDRTAAFLRGTVAGHPTARGLLARGKCTVWSASGLPRLQPLPQAPSSGGSPATSTGSTQNQTSPEPPGPCPAHPAPLRAVPS